MLLAPPPPAADAVAAAATARSGDGAPLWLSANPGRQILSGSFHPVPPEGWAARVHLAPGVAHTFWRATLAGGLATEARDDDGARASLAPGRGLKAR